MKHIFTLSALTASLAVITGCQSASPQARTASPASPEAVAAAPVSPVVELTPAALTTIRIKAGTDALRDSAGNEWLGDTGFEGGDVIDRTGLEIANTRQPEIYQSERYMMDSFKWRLPNGRYQVKLHFAETFEGIYGPGERVFSFEVEGKSFKDFDVWAKAGGFAKAYVETVDVDIGDGQLDIKFIPNIENPQICGIEISPAQ